MHRSIRVYIRVFSYLSLILFLLQITAITPVIAQTEPPPSGGGVLPDDAPAKMTYQPPVDASKLEDFVPSDLNLVWQSVPRGERTTISLAPSRGNAMAFNEGRIGVIMEHGTVPQAARLEFEELLDSTPVTKAEQLTPAASHTLQFQLEVVDQTNSERIKQFDKNVRIVVDMRHFGIDLDEVGGYFYLAYEDENEPGSWIEVPIDTYGRQGLISAEVSHFSNWQSGWRPEAWALEWRPPAVNEFTAAASYQYPFNIPPGRAGLQPTVALSYNSASLRGAIRQVSYGSVATGWSLSDISITRSGIKNGASAWTYPDSFRLTINGTGGRLVQGFCKNAGCE